MMTGSVAALDPLAGWPVWQKEDRPFLERIVRRVPDRFRDNLRRQYGRILESQGPGWVERHREANLMIGRVAGLLEGRAGLTADDEEIRARARAWADRCRAATVGRPPERARPWVERRARAAGVPAPDGDHDAAAVARARDDQWWRRQLRRTTGRNVEAVGRELGMVHKRREPYVSDETVSRRRQQRARNRALLEEVLAVNEAGQEYTLAELADLSVSNPALRRGELMVRIRGTEEMAEAAGHVAGFFTLTTPSRFHAHHASGARNEKWDGSTPREAHHYLTRLWARVRAHWKREALEPYGLRVAEPHHDGTPHWHLLLFMPQRQAARVREILEDHALREAPDEPGARRHRLKTEWIDPEQGSATGYVAKYVAKAIDGHALDSDLFGNDAREAAARIDAWAATWGIRQFQFMGTPPVGLWRELRRLDGAPAGPLGDAFAAADAGNWRRFAEVVAGAPGLAVAKEAGGLNRYGEDRGPVPVGVQYGRCIYRTRRRIWETGRRGEVRRPAYTGRARPDGGRAWAAQIGRLRERQTWGRDMSALWAAMDYARAKNAERNERNKGLPGERADQETGMGKAIHKENRARLAGVYLQQENGVGPGGLDVAGGAAAGPWTGVNNCTEVGNHGGREPAQAPGGAGSYEAVPGAPGIAGDPGGAGGRDGRPGKPAGGPGGPGRGSR